MPDGTNPGIDSQALLQFADNLAVLVQTMAGYRAQCEAAGFSPTAAEQMAVEMHAAFIHKVFG